MPNTQSTHLNIQVSTGQKDLLIAIQEAYTDALGHSIPLSTIARRVFEIGLENVDWDEAIHNPISLFTGAKADE
jgi:hypothetical protein